MMSLHRRQRRGLFWILGLFVGMPLALVWGIRASSYSPLDGIPFQGHGPGDPTARQTIFRDVSTAAGINSPRMGKDKLIGQAWGDVNADGWPDLYVTDSAGPNTLYQNNGDGTFQISPLAASVSLPQAESSGAIFADYDNDGWADLYVLNLGANVLFHNEGGRALRDVTAAAGVGDTAHGKTAAWGDFDQDGWLDLYVANWSCSPNCGRQMVGDRDRLYHNMGDGTFEDVTDLLGSKAFGAGFVASFVDYDNDGDPDIYLVNDEFINPIGNALWRNDGPGCDFWCFTEVSNSAGADERVMGMGLATGDYDNDGDMDFYFSNAGPMVLLQNQGNGTFRDVAVEVGVDLGDRSVGWGTSFFDFDNDGWLDLYLAVSDQLPDGRPFNPLFRNAGDGTFVNLGDEDSFATDGKSLGVAYADYDRDGWIDLIVGNYDQGYVLYRNMGLIGQGNHRITLQLTGGGGINRDAIGTRVEVTTADGRTQTQIVQAGAGLGAGNTLLIHFGLGTADRVQTLEVVWPDGTLRAWRNLLVDREYRLSYLDPVIPPWFYYLTGGSVESAVAGFIVLLVFGLLGVCLETGQDIHTIKITERPSSIEPEGKTQTMPVDEIQDRIFGDLNTLENRITRYQQEKTGIRHTLDRVPMDARPGEAVLLKVTTTGLPPVQSVRGWYTTDDGDPGGPRANQLAFEWVDAVWDDLLWGYIEMWEAVIPPQDEGAVIRYKIGAKFATGGWCFADNQANDINMATDFAYLVTGTGAPRWAQDARVYHIFIDRFNPGTGKNWLSPADPSGFYGGTLRGVTEKLGYIQDLGFNAIWLSPFFPSPSHHGYDATDYEAVEPRLGTKDDFDALIAEAHARNIRVILDFVANHWSSSHPTFQEARRDRNSPYYDWYLWDQWPEKYQTYFDVKNLPKLNLKVGSPARTYLLKTAQYWLQQGVDGYRLDYANGPPDDFWVDFRRACRAVDPECWLFGEIVHTAQKEASYFGTFDGILDFHLADALRKTFGVLTWDLGKFESFRQAHEGYFPDGLIRPAFLDNHDMNRLLFLARGRKERLKLAALVLFTHNQPPVIYYGTEAGVTQERPIHQGTFGLFEEARLPMKWGAEKDGDLVSYFRRLIAIRKELAFLVHSDRRLLHLDPQAGTYGYVCEQDQGRALVALNLSSDLQTLTLDVSLAPSATDRLNGQTVKIEPDRVIVHLEPETGALIY